MTETKSKIKAADGFIIFCLTAFLIFGALKAFVLTEDINAYENRTANRFPCLSAAAVQSGEFQDGVESALRDQVLLSQTLEKGYQFLNASLQVGMAEPFINSRDYQGEINVLGTGSLWGHLIYPYRSLESVQDTVDAKIAALNATVERHPDTEFYAYYIEKDTDADFLLGLHSETSAYIGEKLALPEGHYGIFSVGDFDRFDSEFFRTDHHWNCYGSYRAYTELISVLGIADAPLSPVDEFTLKGRFSGSKALAVSANRVLTDAFPVYAFDYPEMRISVNGIPVEDYGAQSLYQSGATAGLSYSAYYGDDLGEVVFDTGSSDRDNLLIIGESYDNAILKLLASHYNRLYSVDLRYYTYQLGIDFDFSSYLEANNISKVLFIGNLDYYLMSEFNPEG